MSYDMTILFLALTMSLAGASYLAELPPSFDSSTWAYYSFQKTAVLPGSFNRTVFDAPTATNVSDMSLSKFNGFVNRTSFLAYDERFFDLIGPDAKVSKVVNLSFQNHEAACFNPETKELFFTEWGPPGIENNMNQVHAWQYLLDTKTSKLANITTDPPITNAHGCVVYKNKFYIVNDGSSTETAAIYRVEPHTLKATALINNYYQQPFNGFNDLDIDPEGNFWVSDSSSGWERDVIPFTPPTSPTVYMINGTTMRPQVVQISFDGNANGMSYWRAHDGSDDRLYMSNSKAFQGKPVDVKTPYGQRAITTWDVPHSGGQPKNERFFSNPISYFYDGIRASRSGWIFGAAGDGVDVLDPYTGQALGTIRIGGGQNKAVNIALGEHEMWIVGFGGVWHITEIKEHLYRGW